MAILEDLIRDPLALAPPLKEKWCPDVETDDSGDLRVYKTPDGDFPSVTSVLAHGADMRWLEDWKDRIGHEKAEAISERSRTRGTRMHAALETAIRRNGDPFLAAERDTESLIMARALAMDLFPRVSEMWALEAAVWSTKLKVAGRTDGAGVLDGVPAIIDYKNARKPKHEDDILGYFLQSTLYSVLLEERTGIHFPKFAICVSCGDHNLGKVQIITGETAAFKDRALTAVDKFWESRRV